LHQIEGKVKEKIYILLFKGKFYEILRRGGNFGPMFKDGLTRKEKTKSASWSGN
jgi:hypothetical protein